MRELYWQNQFYFKKPFFEELMSMDNAVMSHARFEEKIIPTEPVIYGAENCYSYLVGTDSEFFIQERMTF